MSARTLLRKTSTSGNCAFGGIQVLGVRTSGNGEGGLLMFCSSSEACLLWKCTARRIRLSKLSISWVVFSQLTSFGVGQKEGPLDSTDISASDNSMRDRLMGFWVGAGGY